MIKQILEKIGVFASSLLVTVLSVFIYSPTNGSNATTNASDVKVDIGSSLAFSLSTDKIEMEGRPGQTVISDPIRVQVFTNNRRGVEVYVTNADDDPYMRHTRVADTYIKPALSDFIQKIINGDVLLEEIDEESELPISVEELRVDNMNNNEWGYIDHIMTYAINDGYNYVNTISPVNGYLSSTGRQFGLGDTVLWAKKPNSQYTPGLHVSMKQRGSLHYSYSEYVNVDEDLNFYEDVKFVVKIGNVTSGTYTDTVLFTVYPN